MKDNTQINIYTTLPMKPMHIRLETNVKILEQFYNISIYHTNGTKVKKTFINYLFLNFFFFDKIKEFRKTIANADIIYIQTLYLLPLAIYAKSKKKKVVYETLDNHVHLKFYILSKSQPIVKWLKWLIIPLMSFIEKRIAFLFADEIIVNSKALHSYFRQKSNLLFYTSPFENIGVQNDPEKPAALIYLGFVSKEKGFYEMLDLVDKLKIDLFVFGKLQNQNFLDEFKKRKVHYFGQMSSDDMITEIVSILKKHFLFGISIIHPIHYSYLTQEANKDIDFLSLGIPIIGNNRPPTAEKINDRCGIYYEKNLELQKALSSTKEKNNLCKKCLSYYIENYRLKEYVNKLSNIIKY